MGSSRAHLTLLGADSVFPEMAENSRFAKLWGDSHLTPSKLEQIHPRNGAGGGANHSPVIDSRDADDLETEACGQLF